MFELDSKRIGGIFDRWVLKYGDKVSSVGWSSEQTQSLRFLLLSLIAIWEGQSILDIGCGKGDFLDYCISNNHKVDYSGIDLSHEMVKLASQKFPSHRFEQADLFDPKFKKSVDYVLASGAFSFRVSTQEEYIDEAMSKMFALARKGVAFNLLSSSTPDHQKDKASFYFYRPEIILAKALKLTPYVELRQSYLHNDFTVYMFKESA
jgi:cyclopropane fatty-acyl-phospholipid synthase-like methyltransferase